MSETILKGPKTKLEICHNTGLSYHHLSRQQVACAPSEDSDQPGHPPSLIRVFAVHFMGSLGP